MEAQGTQEPRSSGPPWIRLVAGGALSSLGGIVAVGAPAYSVLAFRRAMHVVDPTRVSERQLTVAARSWMQASDVLVGIGLIALVAGVMVVVVGPRNRASGPDLPLAARAYGIAGLMLGTVMLVASVLWLSIEARWVATDRLSRMLSSSGTADPAPPLAASAVGTLIAAALLGVLYIAMSVALLPIARNLACRSSAALEPARRWTRRAAVLLAADVALGLVLSRATGTSFLPFLIRVLALVPWPVTLWSRADDWQRTESADAP